MRKRLYHVVAINERSGFEERLTGYPVEHKEACTILRKQSERPGWVRKEVKEVTGPVFTLEPGRTVHFGGMPAFVIKRDGYFPPAITDAMAKRIVRLLNEAHERGEED